MKEQANGSDLASSGRRKVVKTIVGGATVVAAYNFLPAKWGVPIIDSVFLPAQAATSGTTLNDPCSVERRIGDATTESVTVRVTGFVTPPTADLPVTVTATAVGGGGRTEVGRTVTLEDGTFESFITLGGGPGITRVNVTTTVEGAAGSAQCSVSLSSSQPSCCESTEGGVSGTITISNSAFGGARAFWTQCNGNPGEVFAGPGNAIFMNNVDITQPIRLVVSSGFDLITSTSNISFGPAGATGEYEGTVSSCADFSALVGGQQQGE